MKKEVPTIMGILIVAIYTFILFTPLFFLSRSINKDVVIFTTIGYNQRENHQEDDIGNEEYLEIVNSN